ncbi:hypothetical protein FOCC_FOCC004440 [Frankliniella occidentalis]|nr:hypothetical protein FOCC_FOCC004440 [Frankliniella occidentalis]
MKKCCKGMWSESSMRPNLSDVSMSSLTMSLEMLSRKVLYQVGEVLLSCSGSRGSGALPANSDDRSTTMMRPFREDPDKRLSRAATPGPALHWPGLERGIPWRREEIIHLEELVIAEPPVEPISSYRDESGYTTWRNDSPLIGESGGGWPPGHPLPLPQWDDPGWGPSPTPEHPVEGRAGRGPGQVLGTGPTGRGRPPVRVANVVDYEDLAARVEHTTQQLLRDHNYNTVGNFLRFYSAYSQRKDRDVNRLFREYRPPITAAHHTCVGLGLTLVRQLGALGRAGLRDALHLVSCEEAIENPAAYLSAAPDASTAEKEHVLVSARLDIGGRKGVLLLDPGYHVARVVTVMEDGMYPHTGWFTQSDEPEVRREYMYTLSPDGKYVLWTVRETRGERQSVSVNLVYIERAYLSAVDVTERRNIAYNFRSLLARNTKGQLTAGVYFPLAIVTAEDGPACTIFYTEVKEGASLKRRELSVEQELALILCSQQLGMHDDQLEQVLTKVASVMADTTFMKQILDINNAIEEMSEEN